MILDPEHRKRKNLNTDTSKVNDTQLNQRTNQIRNHDNTRQLGRSKIENENKLKVQETEAKHFREITPSIWKARTDTETTIINRKRRDGGGSGGGKEDGKGAGRGMEFSGNSALVTGGSQGDSGGDDKSCLPHQTQSRAGMGKPWWR